MPVEPDQDQITAIVDSAREDDGPIVMLNLNRYATARLTRDTRRSPRPSSPSSADGWCGHGPAEQTVVGGPAEQWDEVLADLLSEPQRLPRARHPTRGSRRPARDRVAGLVPCNAGLRPSRLQGNAVHRRGVLHRRELTDGRCRRCLLAAAVDLRGRRPAPLGLAHRPGRPRHPAGRAARGRRRP